MNMNIVLYAIILLAYGDIMYARGRRDIFTAFKKANEVAKRLLNEEGNKDEKN